MEELDESIPEISIDFFNQHILPLPGWLNVEKTRQHLEEDRKILDGKWTAFREIPSKSNSLELEAFKPFKDVVEQIAASAIATSQNSTVESLVKFVDTPNAPPFSDRGGLTQPDGYFELINKKSVGASASKDVWDDIALSCEFKKSNGKEDIADNAQKILRCMHHVMHNDPCRRFALGITVEDTEVRFWFCCRSEVVVTKKFGFMTDHDAFISTIASVCFASDVQLGWDPTVIRRLINTGPCYDITVHDRTGAEMVYQTTGILSDDGAVGFRGRGTRVFSARALDPNGQITGEEVAIKDVWVDEDREREGDIRKSLHTDAPDDEKDLVKNHFLTVLAHGDVKIFGKVDHTKNLLMNGQVVPTTNMFKCHRETLLPPRRNHMTSRSGETTPWDKTYHPRAPPVKNHRYPPKVHYRIVFEEIGVPVHSLESLADVFHALADAMIALRLAYNQEKVHRDVSSGNILMCKGVGKLTDLEYMKKMATESAHEVRTGTLDYMAVEVEDRTYKFTPLLTSTRPPSGTEAKIQGFLQHISQHIQTVFYHNPLHDIESVWWIGVWTLVYRDLCPASEGISDYTNAQVKNLEGHRRTLFPRTLGSPVRNPTLAQNHFRKILNDIPQRLLTVGSCLGAVQVDLVIQYRKAEEGPLIDVNAFRIHTTIEESLRSAVGKAGSIQLSPNNDITKGFLEDSGGDPPTKRRRSNSR